MPDLELVDRTVLLLLGEFCHLFVGSSEKWLDHVELGDLGVSWGTVLEIGLYEFDGAGLVM